MDASPDRALRRAAVAALVCCVAAGCTTGSRQDASAPAVADAPMAASDLQSQYQKVIKKALPSVVQIQSSRELGSGVVYDGKGHIVTNAHVVASQKTFKVTTASSEQPLTARLVYSYPAQDLAVIKLDKVPAGLKAAAFGDSEKVEVGQIVLAMGSPLGLSSSVTQGIVSATGRTVSEAGGGTGATLANMVQTSAPINPGNSGGALVDLAGHVIGIPTLGAADPALGNSAAPGIGFAIPASTVKTIAGQIVDKGRVTNSGRAALGITARTVVNENYQPAGVAVVSVKPDGAADKAGLRTGDIITGLGGRSVSNLTSLAVALAGDGPGQKTTVTYQRDGHEKKATVTLGEQ